MNLISHRFLDGCDLIKQENNPTSNTIDDECNEQSKEKTMVLWDINHMITIGNLIEEDEFVNVLNLHRIDLAGN